MSSKPLPLVLIVCPATAADDDHPLHIATRWARMLHGHCRTAVVPRWSGEPADRLFALDARRSAASVDAWSRAQPARPVLLALTGTDLYRDILFDAATQRALQQSSRLLVMQEQAPQQLSAAMRAKCSVVHASARPLRALPPPRARLRAVQAGTLCEQRDPMSFMRAARRLAARGDIGFLQVGAAAEGALAAAARRTADECAGSQWLGGLPRGGTRQHSRHGQLLVAASRIEGGASPIVDAAQSGTAVLASHVPGNVGLLGTAYDGNFAPGDDEGLAPLLEQARDNGAFLARLRAQTAARAAQFGPADEQRALISLVLSM